jgi:hypothetical protein
VSVNGDPAQYVYKDPLTDVTMGPNTTIGNHQSYKGKYLTALKDADEGELKIMIPSDAVVQVRFPTCQRAHLLCISYLHTSIVGERRRRVFGNSWYVVYCGSQMHLV